MMRRFVPVGARVARRVNATSTFRQLSTESNTNNRGPNLRNDILEASLRNVHALGWTQECIVKAVLDLGLPPLTHRVLGRGPVEVVEYFIEKKRNYAKEQVAALHADWNARSNTSSDPNTSASAEATEGNQTGDDTHDSSDRPGPDRDTVLQVAIEAHIDFIAPYVTTWPNALATFADPAQASYAMSSAMQLADDIVSYGDVQASRGDWYTERVLAVMLYSSTELYMLTDTSPNLQDTK